VFGRLFGKRDKRAASRQEGDPHALDREGDPRGGVQGESYRRADPRDVVEEDGVVMSGPGGAAQEGESVEERRARDEERRARADEHEHELDLDD
jgi:hypothetical protein